VTKEISTKDYMQDGWDSGPIGCHPYKRGSRHNKLGMWIMWIFYGIVSIQIAHVLTVIPFFPIPLMMLIGLLLAGYVVVRVNWE
tara:strand:+ start:281 stop:532 length:252 start_codon:yes stop_codon:yes gene_type:complete